MKKLLRFLLPLSMLSILLACGVDETNDTQDVSNNVNESNNETEEVELTAWAWNVNLSVLEYAAELYQEENPNFTLNVVETAPQDVITRVVTGSQAGGEGLPDIFLISDNRIMNLVNDHPTAFTNLSDYNFDNVLENYADFKSSLVSNENGIYAVPFDVGPAGMFYRRDIFEEAGVDPESIDTWDDFIEAGKTIKQETGIDMVGINENAEESFYAILNGMQGGSYFDKDGNPMINSETSINAMELLKEIKEANISVNYPDWDVMISTVQNGDVATVVEASWYAGTLMSAAPDLSGKWGFAELPAFEEGGNTAANNGGSSFMIPATNPNVEEAAKFMEFFAMSDEVQYYAMEEGGMFPSLVSAYDNVPESTAEYFAGQDIWTLAGEIMEEVPEIYYDINHTIAYDEIINAQSRILNGADVVDTLNASQETVENRIN